MLNNTHCFVLGSRKTEEDEYAVAVIDRESRVMWDIRQKARVENTQKLYSKMVK